MGNVAEHGIAREVAVGVVDELEVVEVRHQDAYRPLFSLGPGQLSLQAFHDAAAVPSPGHGVARCLLPQRIAGGDQFFLEVEYPPRRDQPRLQLQRIVGFDEAIVGARFQSPYNVLLVGFRRDQHDVDVLALLTLASASQICGPSMPGMIQSRMASSGEVS